ncbi:MAG TPA: amino acid permease [Alphaproteobacteria bacterium]
MARDSIGAESRPGASLSVLDSAAIVIGIIIGIGIFKTPALVADSTDSEAVFLLLWIAGGVISLLGALCYTELAAAHPSAGGEYHFLSRAYGRAVGFLFAWGRMTVIQTGAIAAIAFVFGDYAAVLLPLGRNGPSLYAALAVVILTWVNVRGVRSSRPVQLLFTAATVGALAAVMLAGFSSDAMEPPAARSDATGTISLAMVFVLLTYGGWNEAAYLSGEIRDVQRNMARVLLLGLGVVVTTYVLLNLAYLNVLGLDAMRGSSIVAADLMHHAFGRAGAMALSGAIVVAAISTLNGTIFTGARTSYALGRDFAPFRVLGRWDARAMTPANALLVQGTVSLLLVLLGTLTRDGFTTMVEYTAPVFWLFFLLAGLSLFVLRWRDRGRTLPFRVPLYPVTPLVFCGACGYMLYASLAYTGIGALFGGGVLLVGMPLLAWLRPAAVESAD